MTVLPFGYQPLGWKEELSSQDYFSHMTTQLERLSVRAPYDLRQFQDAWRSLAETFDRRPAIFTFIESATETEKTLVAAEPSGGDSEVNVHSQVNQVGNLVVNWQPNVSSARRFDLRADFAETIGGRRALNELLWIRGMRDLRFPIDGKRLHGATRKPVSDECLVSDMMCCIKKQINELLRQVSSTCTLKVYSSLELTLENRTLSRTGVVVEGLVVDWEIVPT